MNKIKITFGVRSLTMHRTYRCSRTLYLISHIILMFFLI